MLKQLAARKKFNLVEMAEPPVRPRTVLVPVAATSVNPVDVKVLEGMPIGPDLPAVLGTDLAGTFGSTRRVRFGSLWRADLAISKVGVLSP